MENITITVSDYLSPSLAEKIAIAQWKDASEARWIKDLIYEGKTESDCFNIVAKIDEEVVGRLFCMQSKDKKELWHLGDLFTKEDHRRRHIAEKMVGLALETLEDRGCEAVFAYIEPENVASLKLHEKLGFVQRSFEPFDGFDEEGRLCFEKRIEIYSLHKVSDDCDIRYVARIYNKNIVPLHGERISYDEWKEAIGENDPDEAHFLICRGAMPVAWMKLNGLLEKIGWISMLAVEPAMQRRGAGKYAVRYSEEYFRKMGKEAIGIHTTKDNIPAQHLYEKCGFIKETVQEGDKLMYFKKI